MVGVLQICSTVDMYRHNENATRTAITLCGHGSSPASCSVAVGVETLYMLTALVTARVMAAVCRVVVGWPVTSPRS